MYFSLTRDRPTSRTGYDVRSPANRSLPSLPKLESLKASKRTPAVSSSPRHMKRTPLSRRSSERPKPTPPTSNPGALDGVKKSIARKRRSLLELSSAVTSGLMQASQPYEDYVPAVQPEYIPFEREADEPAPAPPPQTALVVEAKQEAGVISQVAAKIKQNVHEATVKGKTVVAKIKENVIESVQEVREGVREVSKIQWRSELKKEVVAMQA